MLHFSMSDQLPLAKVQFPDLKSLIDFTIVVDLERFEVLRSKFILIAQLSKVDIALATSGYGAKLIEH